MIGLGCVLPVARPLFYGENMSKNVETVYDPVKELIKNVDIKTTNQILANTELKDFEMNKSTIQNISEWALNGASDQEIRKKLSLNKNQWAVLVTCCPTLLLVMKESRAIADIVIFSINGNLIFFFILI